MGQAKTTIELNGTLYDASTGAPLGPKNASQTTPSQRPANAGLAVDGVLRQPSHVHPTAVSKPKTAGHQAARSTAHATTHKPDRSHTLMRHVVAKPHVSHQADHATSASSKPSVPNLAAQNRQQRASQISKSSQISRFGSGARSSVAKKIAPLAVRPHPTAAPITTPGDTAPPISLAASKTAAKHDIFKTALQTANSHQQAPLKTPKLRHRTAKKLGVSNRTLSAISVSLVIVLLAGFVAYQNVPNVSMQLAAARAGFDASLPGYTPGGFSLNGPIKTSPGVITVSFRSHSDNRSYEVTQKPSDWTSDSLRTNLFSSTDSPTAYQDKGKTIYLYNNGSEATWVNGGILYQIAGNANLSSDQLLSIADSL